MKTYIERTRTALETIIIDNKICTREEGPGYYKYRELAPAPLDCYPKRNHPIIDYWLILVSPDVRGKTIEWINRQGFYAFEYGRYIKIDWLKTERSDAHSLKQKIELRLRQIYFKKEK
jgi:hypothetical protein